jgi:hypothetical protein
MMDLPVSLEDVLAIFNIQNKAIAPLDIAIAEVNVDV